MDDEEIYDDEDDGGFIFSSIEEASKMIKEFSDEIDASTREFFEKRKKQL